MIALVTGATAGIGAEFAIQLAARGDDLVLVARDEQRLRELAGRLTADHGVMVEVLVADLLDEGQLRAVEERVASADRPIDLLVNNAGFGVPTEFDESSLEDELRQFDILARVPLVLSHAALRQMLPRHTGRIVTVSSTAGFAALSTYSAAKSWSLVFSRWANAYYRTSGVSFTAVAPGFVRTEFHERMNVTRESMAPGWMWLDAPLLVRKALRDIDRHKAVSLPTVRYKIIIGAVRLAAPIVAIAVRAQGTQQRSGQ